MTFSAPQSLYNTPPVLSIYITGLVMEDISRNGGLVKYAKMTKEKAAKVYEALREGEDRGILREKVKEGSGSLMNIVFDVVGDGMETKFIGGAESRGMKGLKGHRSVGGIRVSLYNAVTVANVDVLATYMREFIKENGAA
ncbi:PLP-dependent transferase [Coniophora puteana RWD-64-598 SS2]|uniref:phosphoserine transaminase n=1 Tax=Coniophora puteana (strain RWD-64-598) TaxID=741705 RepID=A0A5M3N0W8_CONPW|nr:PLP-dependent transferase [Coniophora puteana RWD-64-598 SS2]EIW85060.1 PLP-dependent transferase [Coniophora puteana RWD-64-598 SS2]